MNKNITTTKTRVLRGVLLLLGLITLCFSSKAVNITFKVDMAGIAPTAVYVGSDWAGWDPSLFQQLTDGDGDGIYEVTIDLPAGASYNYRYKHGARDWNNFESLAGGSCGAGPSGQDRNIVVPATPTVLPAYCFGACTVCSAVVKTTLNLSVDMNGVTVSPNGVHVAGTMNSWNPSSSELTDPNHDGIYTIAIQVTPNSGIQEYKFLNGNSWGTDEVVFGTCEFRSNRIATIAESDVTMPTVKFGYCGDVAEPIADIKIACIGNSITHGAGVSSMYTKSWPIQLRSLLGAGYYTENFGVSGRTMLKTGDAPWWNEAQYNFTFALKPDVVVIKLGTNDSKDYNWNAVNYKADYISLIDNLRTLTKQPLIYISTPAKAYSAAYSINDNTISTQLIPILQQIAQEKMVSLIDMYDATSNMSGNFPDGIHPNDNGALVIATKVKSALLATRPVINTIVEITTDPQDANYNWYFNGALIASSHTRAITATQSGSYQVAVKSATTKDVVLSDPFVLNLGGKSSAILGSNYGVPTSIDNTNSESDVKIFPNPASEILNIENTSAQRLTITNPMGQTVYQQAITARSLKIDTSNFEPGIYILTLYGNRDSFTSKIVIK